MSSAAKHIQTVPRKPRLGFVGLGWIGRNRLESIVQSGEAEVAAVHDVQPDCAAEGLKLTPDAALFSSFDELLQHALDGVVIATPNRFHAEQAIAALEHGIAVFCQKPLGRNAFETRRIVETARDEDCLLGVDLSYGAMPAMQTIKKLVESGALGKIFAVDAKFYNGYGPDKSWFYDFSMSGGGCVLDLGVHLLDLALRPLRFPEIARVQSSLFSGGELLAKRAPQVEDYAVATIETADSTVVNLSCCWNLQIGREAEIEVAFYGTDGGVALRNVDGSFYDFVAERFHRTQAETLSNDEDSNWQWGGLATLDWVKRVAAGEGFDPDAERFVTVAELVDEIYGRR